FGIMGTTAIPTGQAGTLHLDNTAVNINGRLTNGTKPNLTFNSGTFTFLANNGPGAASSETIGTVTLNSGQSTINAGFPAAPSAGATCAVTSAGLVRNIGATVNFVGGTANASPRGTTANKLLFNSGLTSTNGTAGTFSANGYQFFGNGGSGVGNIIPFAEVNAGPATDFASYTANGVAPFANYITQSFSAAGNLAVSSASDILKINA